MRAHREEESTESGEEGAGAEYNLETWMEWLQRTARLTDNCVSDGKVVDWVKEQRRRKWRWAGHVARRDDGRGTSWMISWEPVRGQRAPGRPVTRWEDALVYFTQGKGRWTKLAQDRELWRALEDGFVGRDAGTGAA